MSYSSPVLAFSLSRNTRTISGFRNEYMSRKLWRPSSRSKVVHCIRPPPNWTLILESKFLAKPLSQRVAVLTNLLSAVCGHLGFY